MKNLMEEFLKDTADAPTNTELSEISALAEQQMVLESEVKDYEEILAQKKEDLRNIQEVLLPEAMASIGLSEFKLACGAKVTVKDDVYASIRADYIGNAVLWLEAHNLGDIVKNDVSVKFGRGDKAKAEAVVDFCERAGYNVSSKMSVHPQTLKATVKEQLARGVEFPEEYFSINPVKKSVVEFK